MASASASRTFARALARASPARPSLRTTARFALPREAVRVSSRRTYSSAPPAAAKKGSNALIWAAAAAGAGAGAWWYCSNGGTANIKITTPTKQDYQNVYDEIARLLVEKDDYDDGSYGPVCVQILVQFTSIAS